MNHMLYHYLKDRSVALMARAFAAAACAAYLYLCRVQTDVITVLLISWAAAEAAALTAGYLRRRSYFREIFGTLERLDKKYLISELLPPSARLEDQLYREILYRSGKSVIEEVRRLEREHREYREFIESWIHEAKVPLTNIGLLSAGESGSAFREIREQTEMLNLITEKALFYARLDSVDRDYLIRRILLRDTVLQAVYRHQAYFRRNGVCVENQVPESCSVYCDEKWLEFMLCQVFVNAVKYRKQDGADSPRIRIWSEKEGAETVLYVEDNGIGIAEQELPRIFDRGFTGSNGRTAGNNDSHSTGLGLYLCRQLCERLGLSVLAASEEGRWMRISFHIPDGSSLYAREEPNLSDL